MNAGVKRAAILTLNGKFLTHGWSRNGLILQNKGVVICNLNSAKLDSNKWFLVTAIELLYCADASGTNDDHLQVANYDDDLPPQIKNGEFQLEQDSDVLIPEISCEVFVNEGQTNIKKGLYKMDNPKFLKPLKEISP